ncbi:hypothetical protein KJ684_03195 [Patescibacteria group bacterium]|nr:hypothetical protein [Patescibacteria group bacterium]
MNEFIPNNARLVLKLNSIFGRQHIINALRAFAANLQAGVIKSGEGRGTGSGMDEEYEYKEDYTCSDTKKDIDFYFFEQEKANTKGKTEALNRAIYRHMTLGSVVGKHNISCQSCWRYYERMKKEHCGG